MGIAKQLEKIGQRLKHRRVLRSVVSSHLFFLENPEKSVWGSITQEDEQGIKHAVARASHHDGPMIEIGALFGHTTCLLASLKEKHVPLIAVENFSWNPFHLAPDVHRQFTKRTLRYVLDHCSTEIFDGDAEEFYSANPTLQPSLVFIDALHDYESVLRDIEWAISTGCPVISGHDYLDIHPGVIKAVDEAFGDNISVYGSVWIHESVTDNQSTGTERENIAAGL